MLHHYGANAAVVCLLVRFASPVQPYRSTAPAHPHLTDTSPLRSTTQESSKISICIRQNESRANSTESGINECGCGYPKSRNQAARAQTRISREGSGAHVAEELRASRFGVLERKRRRKEREPRVFAGTAVKEWRATRSRRPAPPPPRSSRSRAQCL